MISEAYRQQNAELHRTCAEYGSLLSNHADSICKVAKSYGIQSILDYGCGKANLSRVLGGAFSVANYDPCIPEYATRPDAAEMVTCTDVLEHVEPEYVDAVLDDLCALAKKVLYLGIATVPARKNLPDGRNAHVSIHNADWWVEAVSKRIPVVGIASNDSVVTIVGSQDATIPLYGEAKEYAAQHPDRSVLMVKGQCIESNEELYRNCDIARKSGFPELLKAQVPPFDGPLVVVGSGRSAMRHLDEIKELSRAGTPIMAIKGAHDWLVGHGIVPTYATACDPQESRHDCFRLLRDDVIYLCASQMHPATWQYMKGRRVILWHCQIDAGQSTHPAWRGVPLVPGGPTTGMRSIPLAYVLGYRRLELYGYDGCVEDDRTAKVDGSKVHESDTLCDVWVGESKFRSSYAWVPQVQSLMPTLQSLPGIKVNAHGDGYFQEVLRAGKAAGWPV